MSTTFWHRFPKADLGATIKTLEELSHAPSELLDKQQREQVVALMATVKQGFAAKSDLDLDLEQLVLCLEFALVKCQDAPRQQLTGILKRAYTYRRSAVSPSGG